VVEAVVVVACPEGAGRWRTTVVYHVPWANWTAKDPAAKGAGSVLVPASQEELNQIQPADIALAFSLRRSMHIDESG